MAAAPLVSVIMSVYNGERFLEEAIKSILNQTFGDFEFIIINDGSTDSTSVILRRHGDLDDRMRIYHQENRGLIASLNRGCRLARGRYIARMDADDVSLPERLTKQVHHMKTNPEIGVLGSWIEYIDENGARRGDWRMPTAPGLIGWFLIFGTCLAHPSVLMRREIIEQLGFYRPEALHAEDYDLWTRASVVTRIANIPEILLQRRVWEGSICSTHFRTQEQNVIKAMHSMMTRLLGSKISPDVVESLRRMVMGSSLDDLEQIASLASLIERAYRAYMKENRLTRIETKEVAQDVGRKLSALAVSAGKISPWKGLVVFLQAVRSNPQLLSMQINARVVRTLVRKVLQR
jgi:glycosyltransferase involved in cell wall biosynthesis